jgi:transposase InsO family protein
MKYIKHWLTYIIQIIKVVFMSNAAKNIEIIALRSQIALLTEQLENKKIKKSKSHRAFRELWVLISKFHSNWKQLSAIFKPDTVIRWHKTAFKIYWRKKSKKVGRPPIEKDIIKLIKKIHKENPLMSPKKIHEMLLSMGVVNPPAPNTMTKYIPELKKPPSEKQVQSWKTFLNNHSKEIWAMDYFVVPTLWFKMLYVLIIINHGSRKIEHFAITTNPNLEWVKQQIRNATPYDHKPKYLIHDNDPVFVCDEFKTFLSNKGIKSKRTSFYSPWQNGIAERVNGIIRQELTNHIIPINEDHLYRVLKEYVNSYYNTHRTHQGIDCKTPIPLPKYKPTRITESKLKSKPILNGLYHTYDKVA